MRIARKAAIRIRQVTARLKPCLSWTRTLAIRIAVPFVFHGISVYRSVFLRGVSIVGITGSCGKTCTKELTDSILSKQFRGQANRASRNSLVEIVRVILRCGWRDKYLLQEISIGGEYLQLGDKARMLRPNVGLVTNVGMDHISAFGSRNGIAFEKSKLLSALAPSGAAVLNADDEFVMSMQAQVQGASVTYGLCESADFRATDVRASWPDRLRFNLIHGNETVPVQTQLCGEHWVHGVLASIATAVVLKVPLETACQSVADFAPFHARMCPVELPNGVTFIRDDWKAPLWTVPASLEFMEQAEAPRKVVVIGTISDYRGDAASKYVSVAEHALSIAEHVVFIGPWASRCLRLQPKSGPQRLHAFANVTQSMSFFASFLRDGDLVLLKGSDAADHLGRIVEAMRDSNVPSLSDDELQATGGYSCRDDLQVVIGLGNPGEAYEGTPHNVGREVVERLAQDMKLPWSEEGAVDVARGEIDGKSVWLLRPNVAINECGATIQSFADSHGLAPRDLILVQDDINLGVGRCKSRMRGSAGGHKGVSSIVNAFQSESIRRVKVGVGRPDSREEMVRYVTNRFPRQLRPKMQEACEQATQRLIELLSDPHRGEHVSSKRDSKGAKAAV